jgi:hypothetical protein
MSPRGGGSFSRLDVDHDRARFMALGGLLMSTMFLFNLLMNILALFLVPSCG